MIGGCTFKNELVAPEAAFIKLFGGSGNEHGKAILEEEDGSYILLGNTTSFTSGGTDILLVKVGKDGNEIWRKNFGDIGYENAVGLIKAQGNDGYIILADWSKDNNLWISMMKVSKDGDEEWSRFYGNDGFSYTASQVIGTKDGGYAIVGSTNEVEGNPSPSNTSDIVFFKTDNSGYEIVKRVFGHEGIDRGVAIAELSTQNDYSIIGNIDRDINGNMSGSNFIFYSTFSLFKEDRVFLTVRPNTTQVINYSAKGITSVGAINFVIGTQTVGGNIQPIIIKFIEDVERNSVPEKLRDVVGFDKVTTINVQDFNAEHITYSPQGYFLISGSLRNASGNDMGVLKADINGNVMTGWPVFFGSVLNDISERASMSIATKDGGIAIIGTARFENNLKMALIKTNSQGQFK
jgi:hypothetical protein